MSCFCILHASYDLVPIVHASYDPASTVHASYVLSYDMSSLLFYASYVLACDSPCQLCHGFVAPIYDSYFLDSLVHISYVLAHVFQASYDLACKVHASYGLASIAIPAMTRLLLCTMPAMSWLV